MSAASDKRYQVFVSSTYVDLSDERRAVIQTIMELDCIPAGMEAFPAADEEQLEFIKKVIDDCDYYVLIIGGRYGSVDTNGVSYTEREYEYAVSKGIPVLAFVHNKTADIPVGKTDVGDAQKSASLDAFRVKIGDGRMVKMWSESKELPGLVALGLSKAIKMKPGIGWVRGNTIANMDLLTEINDLRKLNASLSVEMPSDKLDLSFDVAGLDTLFKVSGTCEYEKRSDPNFSYGVEGRWERDASLLDIFSFVAPSMREWTAQFTLNNRVALACQKTTESQLYSPLKYLVDTSIFERILIQLEALGLIEVSSIKSKSGSDIAAAQLSAKGTRAMFEAVVKKGPL